MSALRIRKRTKRKLIIIAVVIVLAITAIVFFHYAFRLDDIDISGADEKLEEEYVSRIRRSKLGDNTLALVLRNKIGRDVYHPLVEKTEVFYKGPHSIAVKIYRKEAKCAFYTMGEYVYIDHDAYVIECSKELRENIPVVTGAQYTGFKLYKKIALKNPKRLDTVLKMISLFDAKRLSVDMIEFEKDGSVNLYCDDCVFILGRKEDYSDSIEKIRQILPSIKGKNLRVDLTTDKVISTPRNSSTTVE